MFKKAKVGDTVWCVMFGWGKITKIVETSVQYPLEVTFENETQHFTMEGKYHVEDILPTLFWDTISFSIPKQPARKITKWFYIFERDDEILVEGWGGEVKLFNSEEELNDHLENIGDEESEIHIFSFETEE